MEIPTVNHWRLGRLLLSEWMPGPRLIRAPEPPLDNASFNEEGRAEGYLRGVHLFNAMAIHALTPPHGTVVELGCGPGRISVLLARCRPDVTVIGVDIDEDMIALAGKNAAAEGVADRVRFVHGDMTRFRSDVKGPIDTVASVFSLHHLPDEWSFAECSDHIRRCRPGAVHGAPSRFLKLYQVHWQGGRNASDGIQLWQDPNDLSDRARSDLKGLRFLFPGLGWMGKAKLDSAERVR